MSTTTFRLITAALLLALLTLPPPDAEADPPPAPPPYIPGAPLPTPGSFSLPYNIIAVPAPATTDARGVRVGTNADPSQSAAGLPGSKLGDSPNKPNFLTSSSTRNGIAAGITAPQAPNPGVNIGAGNEAAPLENPTGAPPKNATAAPEAAAPTTAPAIPGNPAPVLEDPHGQPPASS